MILRCDISQLKQVKNQM